ncbi:Hypothetical protein I595_1752 [Croceitalea dokdonensis DOKDO 023]|uniref:DUF421 domain-containing protein n=1 Tax=Croceitalea dokdonensis DOKDO 023 TaxID=1300341 RepID=A0A0P7AZS0_9FLAO|nr:YetF domain-containing protein [Croceitalea dokdonensis]KPM32103.1 Hypothetical protein I595_1752 [Croceitalea dokdonensis DOKDO 023]
MDKWFEFSLNGLLSITLTAVGTYVAVILFTRLGGKRSFSKMSSFDFAITVALGSMVATTVLSKSVSLWQGMTGLAVLYILQLGTAYLRRYPVVSAITDNRPMFLMKGATVLHKNLKKAKVTESDLRAKLREANVLELSQVRAVIFETTGDIAVLHSANTQQKIQDWIIQGIEE